uniref:Uncharacterized protein n=1 Tax=Rhizophora mucronata TaxID=61149 RepID=A0A2P2PW84_RHIMU
MANFIGRPFTLSLFKKHTYPR